MNLEEALKLVRCLYDGSAFFPLNGEWVELDHQRPLYQADVQEVCESQDICFEYNKWVRCGPCGIRTALLRLINENENGGPKPPEG